MFCNLMLFESTSMMTLSHANTPEQNRTVSIENFGCITFNHPWSRSMVIKHHGTKHRKLQGRKNRRIKAKKGRKTYQTRCTHQFKPRWMYRCKECTSCMHLCTELKKEQNVLDNICKIFTGVDSYWSKSKYHFNHFSEMHYYVAKDVDDFRKVEHLYPCSHWELPQESEYDDYGDEYDDEPRDEEVYDESYGLMEDFGYTSLGQLDRHYFKQDALRYD